MTTTPDAPTGLYQFEDFELDLSRLELRRNGATVHLEPQVFQLLAYLVTNHDRAVPRDELLDPLWPERYITDAALNSRLMAARKAIGDSGREQRLIKTLHSRGFRFVGEVRAAVAGSLPDPHSAEDTLRPAPPGIEEIPLTPGEFFDTSPEVRFARTKDGIGIAYSVAGSGPPLIRVLGWFTHLEMEWRWSSGRRLWERLAQNHTLVRYDGRGIGLSEPADTFNINTRLADLEAVIEATGFETFALLGMSEGVYAAVHYAATHPERVTHLIAYGGGLDESDPAEHEAWLRKWRTLMRVVHEGWGQDSPIYRQLFTHLFLGPQPSPEKLHYFNEMQRASASPERAVQYIRQVVPEGVEEAAPRVNVPTLVVHRRGDAIVPLARSRRLASLIPGARFLAVEGDNHWPIMDEPGTPEIVKAMETFLGTGS